MLKSKEGSSTLMLLIFSNFLLDRKIAAVTPILPSIRARMISDDGPAVELRDKELLHDQVSVKGINILLGHQAAAG